MGTGDVITLKGAYLGRPMRGQGFIVVYRLAMAAKPGGVMVWVAENIQACLRIFRQAQHQWLVRDILHPTQGVFIVFVLWHRYGFKRFKRFKMFKRFKRFKGFNSVLSVIEKESIERD